MGQTGYRCRSRDQHALPICMVQNRLGPTWPLAKTVDMYSVHMVKPIKPLRSRVLQHGDPTLSVLEKTKILKPVPRKLPGMRGGGTHPYVYIGSQQSDHWERAPSLRTSAHKRATIGEVYQSPNQKGLPLLSRIIRQQLATPSTAISNTEPQFWFSGH